jgi:hypothetical protein
MNTQTLIVEFALVPEGKEAVKTFMEGKGYTLHSEIIDDEVLGWGDQVFVKNV